MNRKTIAQFRKTHDLTQMELSEMMGVPVSTLSAYERGYSTMSPRFERKMTELIEEYGIDRSIEVDDDESVRVVKGKTVIEGVGPDQPVVYNEQGGGQSVTPYRMDLIDAQVILEVAKVLGEGARKYGENNWHNIPVNDHLNHLLVHVYAYLAGDRSDNHLSHAICRAIFALGVEKKEEMK